MEGGNRTRKIVLECSCETAEDEHLLVVGSAREFGDWDVTQGLALTTSPDIYPTWRTPKGQLDDLPAHEDIEYKYVKVGPVDSIWEKGDNRLLNLSDCPGSESEIVVKDGHFYLGQGRRSHVVRARAEPAAEASGPPKPFSLAASPAAEARLAAAAEEASEQVARLAAQQLEQQIEIQRLEEELAAMREAKAAAEQAARHAARQAEQQVAETEQIRRLETELAMMWDAKAAQQAAQAAAQKAADHAAKQAETQAEQQAQQIKDIQKLESELAQMRGARAESQRLGSALEKEKRERERSRTRHTTHTKQLERMIERGKGQQRWSEDESSEETPRPRLRSEGFPTQASVSPKRVEMPGGPLKPSQLESKMPMRRASYASLPEPVLGERSKPVQPEAPEKHDGKAPEAPEKQDGPAWPTGIKDSLAEAVTTTRSIEEALSKAAAAEAAALRDLRCAQLRALSTDLGVIEAVVAKQGPPQDVMGEATMAALYKHQQDMAQARAACDQRRAELEREVAALRDQVLQHVPTKGKRKPRSAGVFLLIGFLAAVVAMARSPSRTRFDISDVEQILDQASDGVSTLRGHVRANMAKYELEPSSGR